MNHDTTVLFRPVWPKELALIEASGFREFPPRLPDQPIFYPVLNEEYAIQIARLECAGLGRGFCDAVFAGGTRGSKAGRSKTAPLQ